MFVSTTVVPGRRPFSGPTAGPPIDAQPSATTRSTAIAVNLGSCQNHVWAAGRGGLSCPSGDTAGTARAPVRRGRVADDSGCADVLAKLIRQYRDPYRPVLATMAEQYALRQVVAAVFGSSRVPFMDTVRAAAIGRYAMTPLPGRWFPRRCPGASWWWATVPRRPI